MLDEAELNSLNDSTTTTVLAGVTTLRNATVGDRLHVRWNSSGDLELLSVGIMKLNDKNWKWPRYLGVGLVEDKQDCDVTDPFWESSDCDDFNFQIPDFVTPYVFITLQ